MQYKSVMKLYIEGNKLIKDRDASYLNKWEKFENVNKLPKVIKLYFHRSKSVAIRFEKNVFSIPQVY